MFTKKEVPPEFLRLLTKVSTNIVTTPDDTMFYAAAYDSPFDSGLKSDSREIACYQLDISNGFVDELTFLDSLCLVKFDGGSKANINQTAYGLFYDPSGGLFAVDEPEFDALRDFLRTYALPGRYWRARTLREDVPENIELRGRLEQEMREAEDAWTSLTASSVTEPSATEPSATEPSVTEPSATEPSVTGGGCLRDTRKKSKSQSNRHIRWATRRCKKSK